MDLGELLGGLDLVSVWGVIGRCGRVGCTMGVVQQSVCLVVDLVAVGGCDFIFNCTMVGQASDVRTALT